MRLIYENPLGCPEDIKGFILEGKARISFPEGLLRLENALEASEGQRANYVYWCPEKFPEDVKICWEFHPVREPGLAMLFFAASGRGGEDLFSEKLRARTGEYVQYHHGDIDAFHLSYFRRKEAEERRFHTCNLRKSYGFHLAAQGADPIPGAAEARGTYRMEVWKQKGCVRFSVDGLEIFRYVDDGVKFGPRLGGGYLGFRQLAPMAAEYRNLRVWRLEKEEEL